MVDRIVTNEGKPIYTEGNSNEIENLRERVRWLVMFIFMIVVAAFVATFYREQVLENKFLKIEATKYSVAEIQEAFHGLVIDEEIIED